MKNLFEIILKRSLVEHLLFLFLGILSIIFFEERLYADSSYYIFRLINSGNFWIEHNRFILAFSQILPFIALKLGFGLKYILLLYSLGHVIFFYSIFLICRYYFKDEYSGVLLLLIQTLGIMSGFFVPMFELYYCAGLLVLFSTILYRSNGLKSMVVLIALSFFILTAHTLSFILFFFIFLLHAAEFKWKFIRTYVIFLLIAIAIFIYKSVTASDYDKAKTNAFMETLKYARYDRGYLLSLLAFLWKYYKELLLILPLSLLILAILKDYFKIILVILVFGGILAIANISYYGFEHTRYQEQVYFPLTFIAAFALILALSKIRKPMLRKAVILLVFALVFIRLEGIRKEAGNFESRISEMKVLIEDARVLGGSKFIVNETSLKSDANWSYPIETMLLSSCSANLGTITICTNVDMEFENNSQKLKPGDYLFRRWEIFPISSLDKSYFKIAEGNYKLIK